MVALELIDAAVLVDLVAGNTEGQAADGFDSQYFSRAVADRGDFVAAQTVLDHELSQDALFGELWIVVDRAEDARAEEMIDFQNARLALHVGKLGSGSDDQNPAGGI